VSRDSAALPLRRRHPTATRSPNRMRPLHSDHSVDYNNLLLFGTTNGLGGRAGSDPVHVYGPGDRGSLPPLFGSAPAPPIIHPENPTPGTESMTELLLAAFAQDINDRMRDTRGPDPRSLIVPHDIRLPAAVLAGANDDPAPDMDPIEVFTDDRVKVTAILVNHRPTFPSFAYRFDTDDGSVVFSGDTAPAPNLVKLARGADVLVHECIDARWIESFVEDLFPEPNDPRAEAVIQHLLGSHTTIEQVGPVGDEAGVGSLVLSHLGPATNPRRRWMDAGEHFSGRLVVGEDLLQLGVGSRRRRRRTPRPRRGT
jgi:ribonuclease BN (tRNA processing enzyme)